MNNYQHEISCPDNKGIRNYLWYDYFHDSKIHAIEFDHLKGIVLLSLECGRDIDALWHKLKGDWDTKEAYIEEHIDTFTYILTFKNTVYFHAERIIMVNDYINGRFKETSLLRKLTAENKKPLYHFRIQTDDGYIDIIFSDFIIRKKQGRVKYNTDEITYRTISPSSAVDKEAALHGDDFERLIAMEKLHESNDPELLNIARKNLDFRRDYEDSVLYAAYLIGKLGDASDIPNLLDLYLNIEEYFISMSIYRCSTVLPKRNIMDAVELIFDRSKLIIL